MTVLRLHCFQNSPIQKHSGKMMAKELHLNKLSSAYIPDATFQDLRSFHLVLEKKSFEEFLHYQYMGIVVTSHATWTSYQEIYCNAPSNGLSM